ncbi:hypothetical protein G9C98_003624 [Cotesia typhae]|uniref:Uncharacterized protein n=1 Tax=Cotesia typhae TaxID=2053667 RepID=A0A8J5USC6_9HYME|nr:hypothetical protein G9C98_003624 [Cotesia typhae]
MKIKIKNENKNQNQNKKKKKKKKKKKQAHYFIARVLWVLPRCEITVTLTLVSSLGIVYCEPEPPLSNQYGVPGNFPVTNNHQSQGGIINSYGAPLGQSSPDGNTHHDDHQDYIDSQPKSYEFGYAVKDSATGNDFGRQETSDGYDYNPGNQQGAFNNNNNNNNYQFGSQGNQYNNNGYSGSSNTFGSAQVPPRPIYGTPQYH